MFIIRKYIRTLIKKLLSYKPLTKSIIKVVLKTHNRSYHLAGKLSPYLESNGLHPKHRLIKYHDWFARQLNKDWNVLDVGCGNGALTYALKANCASIIGIDINSNNIEKACSQFSREGITYVCGDAVAHQFPKKFDAIILSNVLEHIEDRIGFLRHLVNTQGKERRLVLLVRVPMITRDWITLYKKGMGIEWRLDSTHYTEYTLQQLREELSQANLKMESYEIQFGEIYATVRAK